MGIVTWVRQIVANIVQKVTIIVQKVINIVQKVINTVQNVTKIVQLHLLLPAFKPVILITWSILSNQRAGNVPQNVVQTNYVPQVPHMWYSCGTKTSDPQDGKYLIFLKN